jgi:hypothetical protein
MSLSHSLLRSTPYNVSKLPSIILNCRPRIATLGHANSSFRCLATINSNPLFQDVYFTASAPHWEAPPLPPNPNEPRKRDDARKLKLGKSELFVTLWEPMTNFSSTSNPPRKNANSATITTPTRNIVSTDHTPSLPLNTPTPSCRFWTSSLFRSSLDISNRRG